MTWSSAEKRSEPWLSVCTSLEAGSHAKGNGKGPTVPGCGLGIVLF